MRVEEDYQDVLQNIEFSIVSEFRRDRSILDMNVLDAVNALTRWYEAEDQQRDPPKARLTERSQRIFDAVRATCEWRLGRQPIPWETSEDEESTKLLHPLVAAEIVLCLKRLRKSIERWSKQDGRQGYLHFVRQYVE
jgi:hypothetical protein